MSVDFRYVGYVNFRGIRAKLNLQKNKVFEKKKPPAVHWNTHSSCQRCTLLRGKINKIDWWLC